VLYYICSPNIQFTEPRVHAFVYEPGTGEINRLPVDFKPYIDDLQDIYNMYSVRTAAAEAASIASGASDNAVATVASISDNGEALPLTYPKIY
jgi:hypothetical protein